MDCPSCKLPLPDGRETCPRCGQSSADPLLGRRIAGKYQIEAVLGSGGMGCVYRARHLSLDRPVALKVLHPHLAHEPSLPARFLREAQAASRLAHPHIVTLLDYGEDEGDGLLYLVMEYLQGRSLRQVLDKEGPLELGRILRLAQQVLLAMDEAHAHDVVHRDLKPDNILLLATRQGEIAKVVDFGIAQLRGAEAARLTATGIVCGTPAYLSPEQARALEVGPLSDLYSFGVVLFELCTGRLPFVAASPFDIVMKHVMEPPPDPREVAPARQLSPSLAEFILRCLAKDPEQRFSSASEAHRSLAALGERLPAAISTRPADLPPSPQLAPRAPAPEAAQLASRPATANTCSACGRILAPGARFCGGCGTASLAAGTCPACGAKAAPDERFCTSCGAVIATPAEPASARELPFAHLREQLPPAVLAALEQAQGELVAQRREVNLARGAIDTDQPAALFGRQPEQQRIEEAAARVQREGRGCALLLSGEPGTGKSALLGWAAASLRRQGFQAHAVHGQACADGSVLTALVRELLGCGREAAEEEVRQALARLPERTSAPSRGPALGLDALDRRALARLAGAGGPLELPVDILQALEAAALQRLLCLAARRAPLALLVDDLRHLTCRERTIIGAVGGGSAHAALIVLAADRAEALPGWPAAAFTPLRLAPLEEEAAAQLLRELAGQRPLHRETATMVLRAAGGNPLYLVESARLLDAQGKLVMRAPRESGTQLTGIAATLRPLVLARLENVSPPAKQALICAAVIGRHFTVALLSRLTADASALSGALEALCAQGFLEPAASGGLQRLCFAQDLVREVLYGLITASARRTLHQQIAALLLARVGGVTSAAEIGWHLEQAGRDAEAATQLEQAGTEQLTRHEHAEAAALLERALLAFERAHPPALSQSAETLRQGTLLRVKLAQAHNLAGQWEEARQRAQEARQSDEPELALRAGRQLARACAELGRLREAEVVLNECYQAALGSGALEIAAELASDSGEVYERGGNLRRALQALLEAIDLLEALARRSPAAGGAAHRCRLAETLNRLGRVALRSGDARQAFAYLQAALQHAEAGGERLLAARVLGNLGQAQLQMSDKGAGETLGRALAGARAVGDRLGTAKLLYNLARLALQRDGRVEAEGLARESFLLSVELGWREGEAAGAALLDELARSSHPQSKK